MAAKLISNAVNTTFQIASKVVLFLYRRKQFETIYSKVATHKGNKIGAIGSYLKNVHFMDNLTKLGIHHRFHSDVNYKRHDSGKQLQFHWPLVAA